MADALPALISYVNAEQQYAFTNAAYGQWFGVEQQGHQGQRLRDVIGEAAYERIREHVEAALAGERRTFEMWLPYRRAGLRFVRAEYIPHRDEQGHVAGFFALITDLSGREKVAESLRASEERFRATFEQAAVGMAHMREDGRWLLVNEKLCEILGYPRGELLTLTFQDITHTEDLDSDLVQAQRLIAGEIPNYSIEKRFVRKDGTPVWTHLTVSPVRHGEGKPTSYVAVVEDISERKRAEEALRQEQDFNLRLIQTAQAIILVLDQAGKIVRFNRYFEDLTGYALHEVQGKDWFETFLPSRDHSAIRGVFARALGGVRTHGNVNPIVTKDGRERLIEWYDTELTDSHGELTHLLCIGHDITERKALERQIVEAVSEERLRIGQDLHDSVGQELTGLRHLARTLWEILSETDPSAAELAQRIGEVAAAAHHQARALSRGLAPVSLDEEGLMSALADFAAGASQLHGVECKFHCPKPVIIHDVGQATHLYRIVQEAVSNAIRHGQATRIDVALNEENGLVSLSIHDNGAGMPPVSVDEKGIGLKVAAYRAEQIGGTLQVQAGDRGGVLVTCRFPAPTEAP
jgi:PAS domain S-box-containing protein